VCVRVVRARRPLNRIDPRSQWRIHFHCRYPTAPCTAARRPVDGRVHVCICVCVCVCVSGAGIRTRKRTGTGERDGVVWVREIVRVYVKSVSLLLSFGIMHGILT